MRDMEKENCKELHKMEVEIKKLKLQILKQQLQQASGSSDPPPVFIRD